MIARAASSALMRFSSALAQAAEGPRAPSGKDFHAASAALRSPRPSAPSMRDAIAAGASPAVSPTGRTFTRLAALLNRRSVMEPSCAGASPKRAMAGANGPNWSRSCAAVGRPLAAASRAASFCGSTPRLRSAPISVAIGCPRSSACRSACATTGTVARDAPVEASADSVWVARISVLAPARLDSSAASLRSVSAMRASRGAMLTAGGGSGAGRGVGATGSPDLCAGAGFC